MKLDYILGKWKELDVTSKLGKT